MLRTGQTMTRIPLASVAACTASRPDTQSRRDAARLACHGSEPSSSETADMVMTLVSLCDGYAFCCESGHVSIANGLAHRSGGAALRERSSKALWRHGARGLVSHGGAGAPGASRHSVRERRFAHIGRARGHMQARGAP